jgi:integrase
MTTRTFEEQAQLFLTEAMNRKRSPVKPATHLTWRYALQKWAYPHFKGAQLATVTNASVRSFVERLYRAGLSAQTINNYVTLVKLIVASAIDEQGEPEFPRKWNSNYLDLPVISMQRRPAFSLEAMSSIVQAASGREKVLYALLAGSGLRIGEALGLETKHVSPDGRTLVVEQSVFAGKVQAPKTNAAYRKVDLACPLAEMVRGFIGNRKSGLVFANANGNPLSQTNVLRRKFHPLLKEVKIEKQGFHGTRRLRLTWLRRENTPDDLIRFWLGHSSSAIGDRYSKLSEDLKFRQEVAERVGLGFVVDKQLMGA